MQKFESYYLIHGSDVNLPIEGNYTLENVKERFRNLNGDFMHCLKLFLVVDGRRTQILPNDVKPKVSHQKQLRPSFYRPAYR